MMKLDGESLDQSRADYRFSSMRNLATSKFPLRKFCANCDHIERSPSSRQRAIMSSTQMNPADRRMKFSYTFSSKIWNFPYKYYFKHAILARYYLYGFIVTIPIMVKITNKVNNPENKAKWAEIRRKQFSGEH